VKNGVTKTKDTWNVLQKRKIFVLTFTGTTVVLCLKVVTVVKWRNEWRRGSRKPPWRKMWPSIALPFTARPYIAIVCCHDSLHILRNFQALLSRLNICCCEQPFCSHYFLEVLYLLSVSLKISRCWFAYPIHVMQMCKLLKFFGLTFTGMEAAFILTPRLHVDCISAWTFL